MAELTAFLRGARIADEVLALRPDYRALLVVADGIEPGASDERSEALLRTATSQILNSSRDFSVALCDAQGRLVKAKLGPSSSAGTLRTYQPCVRIPSIRRRSKSFSGAGKANAMRQFRTVEL